MKENSISFPKEDHHNHNCTIVFDDGSSTKVFAEWLHNNNLDHWKGWECEAGVTRISITENFDVYSGRCKNDYLGNLYKDWSLLPNATCKKQQCTGCTDDLLVSKSKT